MMVFIGSKWFGDNELNNYVKHLHTLGAMQKDHVTFIQFVKPKDIPRFIPCQMYLYALRNGRSFSKGAL